MVFVNYGDLNVSTFLSLECEANVHMQPRYGRKKVVRARHRRKSPGGQESRMLRNTDLHCILSQTVGMEVKGARGGRGGAQGRSRCQARKPARRNINMTCPARFASLAAPITSDTCTFGWG